MFNVQARRLEAEIVRVQSNVTADSLQQRIVDTFGKDSIYGRSLLSTLARVRSIRGLTPAAKEK
jgi:hypothetical protein